MIAGRPDDRGDGHRVESAEVESAAVADAVAVAHRVAVLAGTDPGAPLVVAPSSTGGDVEGPEDDATCDNGACWT